jgi:hypothetical protein
VRQLLGRAFEGVHSERVIFRRVRFDGAVAKVQLVFADSLSVQVRQDVAELGFFKARSRSMWAFNSKANIDACRSSLVRRLTRRSARSCFKRK